MSKWRPTDYNCLYVIPDIHGAASLLQKIFDRILPLRKSEGYNDKVVLLGDYIDRHVDSFKVIDMLIAAKKKHREYIVPIKGNHEMMLMQALNIIPNKSFLKQEMDHAFQLWKANGGLETIAGYYCRSKGVSGVERNNLITKDAAKITSLSIEKLHNLIPNDHIEFFQKMPNYHKHDDYWFVHAGCLPDIPLEDQDPNVLVWNRGLYNYVLSGNSLDWEQTIVTGHNGSEVIIRDKYMMLDVGSPKKLLVVELNSMEAFMANPGKSRMVQYKFKDI